MNAENGTLDMDCNSIYLPYGDGASFSGFRKEPWPVPGKPGQNLTFRGLNNLDAAIEFAMTNGMAEATEVVITGVSAGGLSAFLHMDRIADRVRVDSPHAKVRGAPVVGFFLDHANYANNSATSYTAEMHYLFRMQNLSFGATGGMTEACHIKHPSQPWLCFMSPHMFDVIQTPLFVFNSRFDAFQLGAILQLSSWPTADKQHAVIEYGSDFLTAFAPLQAIAKHGAFISTCICHSCDWGTLTLEGKTAFQHYEAWYEGSTTGAAAMHVDLRMPNGGGTISDPLCAKFPTV